MGVVNHIVAIGRVGETGELIGSRRDDRLHQAPQVVAVFPEILGERREQLGVGRRIGGAEVIHRIDNAAAEELAPNPVDRSFGEVGVLSHPARQFFARVGIGGEIEM